MTHTHTHTHKNSQWPPQHCMCVQSEYS